MLPPPGQEQTGKSEVGTGLSQGESVCEAVAAVVEMLGVAVKTKGISQMSQQDYLKFYGPLGVFLFTFFEKMLGEKESSTKNILSLQFVTTTLAVINILPKVLAICRYFRHFCYFLHECFC